ncbi:related to triglyceride lipase-cholesterol esterase [Ramularia collo-cygni]|uniref:Related to triglyceride lipase-cholesterol esterase n=1 Tax=Ramularia collo-cygni TaxID=112498 RepID=A0A2D3VI83_9PEZI|nr:related to triglyceride lipase-cholesterol esterase [Ramularia collo-cygni]CZT23991.1 related to triglyceride lipase-cholesterol esterase [Ramularia collo-cygni]
MPPVPFVGRLHIHEYLALGGSFVLLLLEVVIRTITLLLPTPIIHLGYRISRNAFNSLSSPYSRRARNKKKGVSYSIAHADDFVALCELYGYSAEEHVVQTKDGFLLGVHRLAWRKGEEDQRVNCGPGSIQKKVIYLHHGLMMNSEVWVCITEQERCLPFLLVDQGYDVWLGNNRGNKYSKKSLHYGPIDLPFWNFSMDDFAFHDIPDSINYILSTTEQPSLSYIGFSQGTAQAFATLSIHPTLNSKVDVFVALAPAMAPPGLASGIVSSLVKSNPEVLYLAFGRRAMLSSTTMWQAILYPAIFTWVIDKALSFLFGWKTANITPHQKLAAYPHLYSFTSTKSVVHWFQIIRNGKFQMFDDEVTGPGSFTTGSKYYKVAKFPTRNIKTPIVLVYGGSDSLVDIKLMLKELPRHTVAKCVPKYEHLDLLWASDVEHLVFPHVLEALNNYATPSVTKREALGWTGGLELPSRNIFDSTQPPGYSDDEQSRRMPETPISDAFRRSHAEEQMDESDQDDEMNSSREGLMLAPSAFAHSSASPRRTRTLQASLLPGETQPRN